MALANAYLQTVKKIPDLFERIRDGQAPERFTQQLLRDWGFTTKNDRSFIPLLKQLGFLTPEGKPTQRYNDYRDHSRSKVILAQALRETYSDIFLIKEHPTSADRVAIEGKFKSFHNASENVASLMAKTFISLLPLADFSGKGGAVSSPKISASVKPEKLAPTESTFSGADLGLHYNIQIHLPATKDVEVYNAIFKSLREHFLAK